MLAKNQTFENKIKNLLQQQQLDLQRDYDWIDNVEQINFWEFLSVNYLELDRFFTLLDIETGPTSGWERFVEAIGLNLWEDRKWCNQYHNGAGPTRAALCKILSKSSINWELSLSNILLLIKEMGRFDILLQIEWAKLIDKFSSSKFIESNSKGLEKKESSRSFVLRLHYNLENSLLVQSGNCGQTYTDSIVPLSLLVDKNKSSAYVKKKKVKSSYPTILITYAKEAENEALKIAEQLKKDGEKRTKVNSLLLHSSVVKRKLLSDTYNILHSWFNQVRYIVPILSPQYIQQIQNLNFETEQDPQEALHNRLIYRLVLDQYVNYGSRNLRCRPICPDRFRQVLTNSVVKGNGIFSIVWSSNPEKVEDFGRTLMDKPLLH